jgi:glycosyltransferase involved in cell wall biosynthesis
MNYNRILFINQWPSHLTKDIINAFAGKTEQVALLAGYISESGNPLDKKVKISRIVKYNKKNTLSRLITWLMATIQAIVLVNLKYRKYHLFLTSNPPSLAFIPLFCSNSYSVQILDIYPDALVAGQFLSQKSWLNRFWRNHNRKYFSAAKNVFTITEGMAKTISQYCNPEKIKVIPQWPSSDGFNKIERYDNKFVKSNGLENYFIIMYSGNIGLGHHVATLVESARLLKDHTDIRFVIIGEGWNKPIIEKMIREYKLDNCILLPFQPTEMFRHSSQAADIGVVSVSKELAMLSVPIKTYNTINNEVPLLCITEDQSELAVLVSKYKIGKWFAPDQVTEISDYIISLKKDKNLVLNYKKNLRLCAKDFTSKNAFLYLNSF